MRILTSFLSRVFEHETYVNRLRAKRKVGHVFGRFVRKVYEICESVLTQTVAVSYWSRTFSICGYLRCATSPQRCASDFQSFTSQPNSSNCDTFFFHQSFLLS
jgi:hypothetical protein